MKKKLTEQGSPQTLRFRRVPVEEIRSPPVLGRRCVPLVAHAALCWSGCFASGCLHRIQTRLQAIIGHLLVPRLWRGRVGRSVLASLYWAAVRGRTRARVDHGCNSSLLRARLDCQNKSGRNVPVSCRSTQMQSRTAPHPTAARRRARADLHLAAKSPDYERIHRRYAPHSAFNKIGRRPDQAGGVG